MIKKDVGWLTTGHICSCRDGTSNTCCLRYCLRLCVLGMFHDETGAIISTICAYMGIDANSEDRQVQDPPNKTIARNTRSRSIFNDHVHPLRPSDHPRIPPIYNTHRYRYQVLAPTRHHSPPCDTLPRTSFPLEPCTPTARALATSKTTQFLGRRRSRAGCE
ncbi:hypothetical protein BDV93DRAFT_189342 [Ceratobasidium sp. AG-I]|nr:hypothetical protein BDV93DRAFT_189342 [Ceratobasidium sp. AG-I]